MPLETKISIKYITHGPVSSDEVSLRVFQLAVNGGVTCLRDKDQLIGVRTSVALSDNGNVFYLAQIDYRMFIE